MSVYWWIAAAGAVTGLIRGLRKRRPRKPHLYVVEDEHEEE